MVLELDPPASEKRYADSLVNERKLTDSKRRIKEVMAYLHSL
jgi:hypothetical protein